MTRFICANLRVFLATPMAGDGGVQGLVLRLAIDKLFGGGLQN